MNPMYVAPARYLYEHAHLYADDGRTVCGQQLRDEELWQTVPPEDVGKICHACRQPDKQPEELTLI